MVARTDSDAAKYLDCNIDDRDIPFIIGEWTTPNGSKAQNTFPDAVTCWRVGDGWMTDGNSQVFAVLEARKDASGSAKWGAAMKGTPLAMNIDQMREIAASLGVSEVVRTSRASSCVAGVY